MRVEPAHVDQIRRGVNGRMVLIDADAGGVAQDLQSIDPNLRVRFAEAADPPCWIVFWESDDRRETQLVLSAAAHQTDTGIWTGLDQRVVERVREIDSQGRSGYDYAAEVAAQNARAHKAKRDRFSEKIGEHAGELQHALKKDLGVKNRAFIKAPDTVA
jgi:hypothetical protein